MRRGKKLIHMLGKCCSVCRRKRIILHSRTCGIQPGGKTAAPNSDQTVVNRLDNVVKSHSMTRCMLVNNPTCLGRLLFVRLFSMCVLNHTVVANQPLVKSQKVSTPTAPR